MLLLVLPLRLTLQLALTGSLLGVLRELEIIELIGRTLLVMPLDGRRSGRFRIPKKVSLQGQVRLGHGARSDERIVRLTVLKVVACRSPQAVKVDSKVGQGSWCM